jgi:chromosome segregation ATPase
MRTSGSRSKIGKWLTAYLVIAAGPSRLEAQQADSVTPAPTVAQADSFLLLVPNRDTADVQREIGAAVQRRMRAEASLQRFVELRSGTQLRVDDMKRRIDAIGERANAAKKEKREADRTRLEAERKAAEREKSLLERRVALRAAEMEVQKKQSEAAELERKALELEVQLALKRADPARPAPGTVVRASYDQVLSDLERQVLEAQRAAVAKAVDATSSQKDVVERRLEILEAQRKVVGGK